MPEQPQWSERTLDMPPQDPWADVPTTPDRGYAGSGHTGPRTRPEGFAGPPTRPENLTGSPTRPDGVTGPPTRLDGSMGARTQPAGYATRPPGPIAPSSGTPGFGAPGSGAPGFGGPGSGAPGFGGSGAAGSGAAGSVASPSGGPAPSDLPFSAGRASVRPNPRAQQFAAEHEPTGTGWPGAEVPYTRPSLGELRRGGEWTTAALLWAFVCWGIWALSNDGVWTTKIIIFVVSLVVAGGLFALSRLVGRIVLEKQFHRVRRSARGSHLVASLFLLGVGLAHLQQTGWVMDALGWVINAFS